MLGLSACQSQEDCFLLLNTLQTLENELASIQKSGDPVPPYIAVSITLCILGLSCKIFWFLGNRKSALGAALQFYRETRNEILCDCSYPWSIFLHVLNVLQDYKQYRLLKMQVMTLQKMVGYFPSFVELLAPYVEILEQEER